MSTVFAQQKRVENKWYGIFQQGVLLDNNIQVQPGITGGYQYKGFGGGLAAAFDFSDLNSLQIAADLRKIIKAGNQYLFVYANPGFNIVTASNKEKDKLYRGWYGNDYNIQNGYYLETGAGILIGKSKNLLAAFYWSKKTHSVQYKYDDWNPVTITVEEASRKEKYAFNRLGIKVGFIF